MIFVRCPSCGESLTADTVPPEGSLGCPRCGGVVTLAGSAPAETVAALPDPDSTRTAGGFAPAASLPGAPSGPGSVAVPGYEILGELGRGGMGVVFKARQFNPPRVVALKMILAGEHAAPEQVARFRSEAEAIARLSHPAIVQIHQVGECFPDGGGPVPYLTLEYVEGRPLSRRLADGRPVSARQAADLVARLARGVHYAHSQGVVHRDLKPGNVLLAGEEGPDTLGEPKIVDFGLAKPLDGFASIGAAPQTRTGAVLGTPSYMAPEQATGKGKVGPATDVYSLGVILYELLAGRPPFVGDSVMDTLIRVAREEPEPPRRLRPKVPRDLETVCLTCLAKAPERRYPSAAELAADLERFLAGEPVRVRPPSRLERLGRWVRSRKELVYLAVGAVIGGGAIAVVLFRSPPADPPRTDSPDSPQPNPGSVPGESPVAELRRRVLSQNNLKQLVLGLHSLHDKTAAFPPAAITDKAGKPLLSWRVAVLPFIEHDDLYKQFKLDEPWDSEHNKKLVEKMPKMFHAEYKSGPPFTTHYQAVVGPGTAWEFQPPLGGQFGRQGLRITSFTDGTSNTILLVEVPDPVTWTKPDDVNYDGKTVPKLGGVVRDGFNLALTDGSVHFVRQSAVRDADLRAALTRAGGEVLSPFWEDPPQVPQEKDSRGATRK